MRPLGEYLLYHFSGQLELHFAFAHQGRARILFTLVWDKEDI